ncbi:MULTISPECIES: hypothetical protein [unclassified Nostoc]|uniref:hypothetical protein n=1 Tax=unclassified Nostoc TaxID=2593658 RepID=UPI002AD222A7|nr:MULTISPECIES: hypothetical protein [unclassified Nostoc]MDZ8127236.1 hypothetical protein [Nostoc sp. CmiVER01]MDZ8226973.1 hypothetical protein [Nostoc sp. ChiVER01]
MAIIILKIRLVDSGTEVIMNDLAIRRCAASLGIPAARSVYPGTTKVELYLSKI